MWGGACGWGRLLPELLQGLDVMKATDLIPALVAEPARGGVLPLVLQAHTTGQQEHELLLTHVVASSKHTHTHTHTTQLID